MSKVLLLEGFLISNVLFGSINITCLTLETKPMKTFSTLQCSVAVSSLILLLPRHFNENENNFHSFKYS